SRSHRSSGEDPRIPDRAGGDRGGVGRPSGGAGGGGAAAGGEGRPRHAPGGLRGGAAGGGGVAACARAGASAGAHGAVAVDGVVGAAVDGERQGGSAGVGAAVSGGAGRWRARGAADAGGGAASGSLGGGAEARAGVGAGELLRPRGSLAPRDALAVADPRRLRGRAAAARRLRNTDARRPRSADRGGAARLTGGRCGSAFGWGDRRDPALVRSGASLVHRPSRAGDGALQ